MPVQRIFIVAFYGAQGTHNFGRLLVNLFDMEVKGIFIPKLLGAGRTLNVLFLGVVLLPYMLAKPFFIKKYFEAFLALPLTCLL